LNDPTLTAPIAPSVLQPLAIQTLGPSPTPCAIPGVNYCGVLNSLDLNSKTVTVNPLLNEACCKHDDCYGENCVSRDCDFTLQTLGNGCDEPLIQTCLALDLGGTPLTLTGILTKVVCTFVECTTSTFSQLPFDLAGVCLSINLARLIDVPCNGETQKCNPCPNATAPHPCVSAAGEKFCCPAGTACANNICTCPSGETLCGTTCCPPGSVCLNDTCSSCPSGETPCGTTCCPAGESCCGTTCCPAGSVCLNGACGSSVCPSGMTVCAAGMVNQCCAGPYVGGYVSCCTAPAVDTRAAFQFCPAPGYTCCGAGGCPPGPYFCCDNSGCCATGDVCCPGPQGAFCCPPGMTCGDPTLMICLA
jgi:hypothetical protein